MIGASVISSLASCLNGVAPLGKKKTNKHE